MMLNPDWINGLFEATGGFILYLNVKRIMKDKTLRGVSLAPTVFFSAWGFWNLYYYPSLGQWLSFIGGLGVVSMNTLWCLLALYYRYKEKKIEQPNLSIERV